MADNFSITARLVSPGAKLKTPHFSVDFGTAEAVP
jgi:hypothetical protein